MVILRRMGCRPTMGLLAAVATTVPSDDDWTGATSLCRSLPNFSEETMRTTFAQIALLIALFLLLACGQVGPKSKKSFDDIRDMVNGRTAAEVERLLGEPDSRQQLVLSGERWTWWNYTYLGGKNYPPEMRGRVVHLEIIFERVGNTIGNAKAALSDLKVADPLAVSYTASQPSM